MFSKPKISIIIPVYNVEKYLCECLDSILNQTFQDFEIICVDDGSTDETLEILKNYKNKDERVFVLQQHHSGAAEARNNGIRLARGKYIQFLDSDDYFEPTMLEELYNHAEKYGADLTVCSSRKVDNEGNIVESGNPNSPINLDKTPLEKTFNWRDYKDDFFSLINVAIWNKLYSRDLILKNNLSFQNLTSCNDVAFGYISQICAEKIIVFNKKLVNYRCNRCGNISENRAKNAKNIILAAIKIKEFLDKNNLFEVLKKSYIVSIKNHIIWQIGNSSDLEYREFVNSLQELMPKDWMLFRSALIKDYITLDSLNKSIGDKKVMLWGASLFIKTLLSKEKEKNQNILGFIDRNSASWGEMCGNYKIYSPYDLNKIKPDGVILTIFSNNEAIYKSLKKDFPVKYPHIELLPNILEDEE